MLLLIFPFQYGFSQVISFKTLVGNSIQILNTPLETLDFGSFIKGSEVINMVTMSDEPVCIEVQAPTEYDVTVWFDFPPNLTIDPEDESTLPATFRFAYNNRALPSSTCSEAKLGVIEVPDGFNSATFPVRFRSSGQPLPPPTPEHDGYSVPTSKFYLFVYGQAGPAATDISSGEYTGVVQVNIQFTSND